NKKAKVRIIVDDAKQSRQIYDLIQLSKTSGYYEISLLIIQKKISDKTSLKDKIFGFIQQKGIKKLILKVVSKLISKVSFELLLKYERSRVKKNSLYKNFYETFDLDEFKIQRIYVTPNISESGFVYRYGEEDLKKIKDNNLDLLIRGGNGILRGNILSICPNGIISFHHGDNERYRGYPAGFWEVLQKHKSTGFVIQILKDELDGGDVLFKGCMPTSSFYSLNLARLYTKSNIFMHQTIENIFLHKQKVSVYPKVPYSYPLYSYPNIGNQLKYTFNTVCSLLSDKIRRLSHKTFRWSVAYYYAENWRDVTLRKSKKIQNPSYRFLADPFVIKKSDKHYIFVEDYDYRTKFGSISVYEVSKDGHKALGFALQEKFHLSYPFLLQENGQLYMCPETHHANDIRLYKCVNFPLEWELERVLIKNVSAADTNIFKHKGKWWIMTNIDSSGVNDHNSELHIFSSNELLSENWTPHPKNPVIFNSEQARNGGLLFENNEIYRVFQKHGFGVYGEEFGVSRIVVLNGDEYKEEIEFQIMPKFFHSIKGTHTYNYDQGLAVTDLVQMQTER
ncbi:MAG: hypothetical protein KDC52_04260, partial [Ignavibacteriae bacterium]|nr:hypothetical protein [Ignavibacteriota bacterium]